MTPFAMPLVLIAALAGDNNQPKKDVDPLAKVQAKVYAVLSQLDPNAADKEQEEEKLRQELYRIVDTDLAKLRPAKGSTTFVSNDRGFVLVIGANGQDGANGQAVLAEHGKALIVMAVAGDGAPEQPNARPGFGGLAQAQSKNGIAIALSGRGGPGGAGGGGSRAEGAKGSIGLGGNGGKAMGGGGDGGRGGGSGIQNGMAIVETIQKLKKP